MILALDSSSENGSAALVADDRIVREIEFPGGRSRAGGAAQALATLAEVEARAVVVGLGPGSYNGIRSAVALAWGFARARRIRLSGIPSLLGLAPGEFLAAGDARQSQFYFAHVREWGFVTPPELVTQVGLLERLAAHPTLEVLVPTALGLPRERVSTPRAALLAHVSRMSRPAQPTSESASTAPAPIPAPAPAPAPIPIPIYLKPPHVTTPSHHKP